MATKPQIQHDLMRDLRDNSKYKKMTTDELTPIAKVLAKKAFDRQSQLMKSGVHYLTAESEAYRETLLSA